MTLLTDRFRAHLERSRLLADPGIAIVAVSGGPDSAALLDLLAGRASELALELVVAHADHGIQPGGQSAAAARIAQSQAEQYGLPFELTELTLGPRATETLARRARYAWLRDVQSRRGARYLVTAHHADDQIETVVLRVLRGTAPAGLAGIAASSRGGLVRPLLPFTRAELGAHVAARGLPVHDDPANRDPRHLRSWIRTALLPLIVERLGPDAARALRRVGRYAAWDRRAWDVLLDQLPEIDFQLLPRGFDVARAPVARYDAALASALLRAAARRAGLVIGPERARSLAEFAGKTSGRALPLGGGWLAEIAFDRLRVTAGAPTEPRDQNIVAEGDRGQVRFGTFEVRWQPETAPARLERVGWTTWIAHDGMGFQVRGYHSGDRIHPLGGVGHRPVRELLMEARVPRSDRPGYPIVTHGAQHEGGESTVLWIPGVCRGAVSVPTPGTLAVRIDVTHGESQPDRRA
ncbi:MAG TPA: tRNA lysidine(34) synthetase TilS [Gemmatimonadales bacterium]|nr:tRNA lysidine(34) synthetase TilS [Gemmatimonadales bacterium]